MRVHSLAVTAFGPFGGTQTVDFDALSDAGLFLLCGPTGAGKTSVLDAICFGLYGDVPGDRASAKRLRSDHAAPGVAPQVVLEATISGRRFRLRRSPTWTRPKRRGSGVTTEHARVTLEESVDGRWVHLSSRLDETGQLVSELLGMSLTQFCQVAMLPQGRFQAFLRARSDERHRVLQQLFRTSHFEDVERWLVAHRKTLALDSRRHQERAASVVSRLSEVAVREPSDSWDLGDLSQPVEAGEVTTWVAELLEAAQAEQAWAETQLDAADRAADEARGGVAAARQVVELRRRHADAQTVQRRLEATEAEAEQAATRLEAGRRASAVMPLVRIAEATTAEAERAQGRARQVVAQAAHLLGGAGEELGTEDLATAERDAHEVATVARALLPREQELRRAELTVQRCADRLAGCRQDAADVEDRRKALPRALADTRTGLQAALSRCAERESLQQVEARVRAQRTAAQRAARLRDRLMQARCDLVASVDVAQSLRERLHDLREARIDGMAAELAMALASGDSCPVCGSADHPAPARPVNGAPTRADEDAARAAYEDADFDRQARDELVRTLEQDLAAAGAAAGERSLSDLDAELEGVHRRQADCAAAAEDRERLERALGELERQREDLERRGQQLHAEIAGLEAERAAAESAVEAITAELGQLLSRDGSARSVERLLVSKERARAAFAAARVALEERDAACSRAQEAGRQATLCAVQHGFDSTEEAMAAFLDPPETSALEDLLARRDREQAAAQAVLADPAVLHAVALEAPDLPALEQLSTAADAALKEAAALAHAARERRARLVALGRELAEVLSQWTPVRAACTVAHRVSTFAEGKGGDNRWQMRLSAYVLASRLQQVVASANERLRTMSDERYTLEHSFSRGAGELRGGLSLLVRDEWTGESRDPATLSGGETFVVSLALALGLADVVASEAGGSEVDTLFIDEGFGTLDPDTLDDVMTTLDGLRNGGRVVGIVSHVPEMRTRIISQLQIRKDRSGSRIETAREPV